MHGLYIHLLTSEHCHSILIKNDFVQITIKLILDELFQLSYKLIYLLT